MDNEQFIVITEADDGQRLDRWLKKHMPFGLVQKLVRKGAVRVDGNKVKSDVRLSEGQTVRLPPFEEKKPATQKYRIQDHDRIEVKNMVLYDDGDIIVINKPHGLASQGGTGIKRSLDDLRPILEDRQGLRPKLIHRLDQETSGLLVMARKPETIRALGHAFKNREIKKIYWAIVTPLPEFRAGTIRAAIGDGPVKERKVIDEENGKKAQTDYAVIDQASKVAAFVAFWPHTGRTHQIRIHAADILECPVLGDERYEGLMSLEGIEMSNRLHLHARRLVLPIPGQDKELDITAPLSDDLVKTWKALGFDPNDQSDPFEEQAFCRIDKDSCVR